MFADFIEKSEIKLVLNGFFGFETKLVFLLSEQKKPKKFFFFF